MEYKQKYKFLIQNSFVFYEKKIESISMGKNLKVS